MAISDAWHLDKKITIGIILSICANSGSFIWYGAKLDSQVESTKQDVAELKMWKDKQDDDRERINGSLSAVNQKLTDQADVLRRIEDILEHQRYRGK